MRRVFWDTMLFVYLIERNPEFRPKVVQIRERMLERNDQLCTSAVTLGEVLAGALAANARTLAGQYRLALSRPHVEVVDFTEETAEHYARIRADRSIRPADAIQLACAAQAKADLFVTNDLRLTRKIIPGVKFIADLNFNYL
jgi:predicted nucleic acid-binding protein